MLAEKRGWGGRASSEEKQKAVLLKHLQSPFCPPQSTAMGLQTCDPVSGKLVVSTGDAGVGGVRGKTTSF